MVISDGVELDGGFRSFASVSVLYLSSWRFKLTCVVEISNFILFGVTGSCVVVVVVVDVELEVVDVLVVVDGDVLLLLLDIGCDEVLSMDFVGCRTANIVV